ncbi:MAG: 3-deoxy-D-manno-octulosonic acid transferase [Phycisphaerales bacterium]
MSLALDAIYGVVAVATAPWWMRKARGGWRERFGHVESLPQTPTGKKRLLLHTVSVGETNLVRPLVEMLTSPPHAATIDLVISATTDTGLARARELYATKAHVTRYPLDASWSVRRFLDAVRPDAVALTELELWPNFATQCDHRGIPMSVINGRLSERSFKRYRWIRWYLGGAFAQLRFAAAQDEAYCARFVAMGVPHDRCTVAGTMKWDAAHVGDTVPGADQLAAEMGIDRTRPLIVAGSTAPDEHELLHRACPDGVQLLCAPRRPEWFDAAAGALSTPNAGSPAAPPAASCVRRSRPGIGDPARRRFVLDTIGELRMAYALADVVVVGRSFGTLYGSDPMEPAALGKPVVIGPSVADFAATVGAMKRDGAIIQTTRDALAAELASLCVDAPRRAELAERARACVLAHQGATRRHLDLLLKMLRENEPRA